MKIFCSVILCICLVFSATSAVFADVSKSSRTDNGSIVSDLNKKLNTNIQDDYTVSAALSMIKMLDELSPAGPSGFESGDSLLGYINKLGINDVLANKSYSNLVKDKLRSMYDSIEAFVRGTLTEDGFLELIKRGNGNLFGINADELLNFDDNDVFGLEDIIYVFNLLGIEDELSEDEYEYSLFSMLFIMRMVEFYYGESDYNIQPLEILYIMYVISTLYNEGMIDDFDIEKIKELLSYINSADVSDIDGSVDTSYHYLYPASVYLQKIRQALLSYGMPADMVDGFISTYGNALINYSQDKIRALAEDYVRSHSSDDSAIDTLRNVLIKLGLPSNMVDAFLQAYGSAISGYTQEQLIAEVRKFIEEHSSDIPIPEDIIATVMAALSEFGGNIDEFLSYLHTSRDQLVADIMSGKETIASILSKIQTYTATKRAEIEAAIRSKISGAGIDISAFLSHFGSSIEALISGVMASGESYLDGLISKYNDFQQKIATVKANIQARLAERLPQFLAFVGQSLDQVAEYIAAGWADLEQLIAEFDYQQYSQKIESIKNNIQARLAERLPQFLESVGQSIDQLAENIAAGLADLEQLIAEFDYQQHMQRIESIKNNIQAQLAEQLPQFLAFVGKNIEELAEDIANGVEDLGQRIAEFLASRVTPTPEPTDAPATDAPDTDTPDTEAPINDVPTTDAPTD